MNETTIPLVEYQELSELFRFYLGLVLQTVTFTLGVTGAVVTYVLKDRKSRDEVFGLLIPAALCLAMGIGFLRGVFYSDELGSRLRELAGALRVGLPPHVNTLSGSLGFFGGLLLLVGIALLIAFVRLRRSTGARPTRA